MMHKVIDIISYIYTFLTFTFNMVCFVLRLTYQNIELMLTATDKTLSTVGILSSHVTSERMFKLVAILLALLLTQPYWIDHWRWCVQNLNELLFKLRMYCYKTTQPRYIAVGICVQFLFADMEDILFYYRALAMISLGFIHNYLAVDVNRHVIEDGGDLLVESVCLQNGDVVERVVVPASKVQRRYKLAYSTSEMKKGEKLTDAPVMASVKSKHNFALLAKVEGGCTFVGNASLARAEGDIYIVTAAHNIQLNVDLVASIDLYDLYPVPAHDRWLFKDDLAYVLAPANFGSLLGVTVLNARRLDKNQPVYIVSRDLEMKVTTSSGPVNKAVRQALEKHEWAYSASTREGDSGAPVMQGSFIVGVHSGSMGIKNLNYFTSLCWLTKSANTAPKRLNPESTTAYSSDFEELDVEDLWHVRFTREVRDKLSDKEKSFLDELDEWDVDDKLFRLMRSELEEVYDQGYTLKSNEAQNVRRKYMGQAGKQEKSMSRTKVVVLNQLAGTSRVNKALVVNKTNQSAKQSSTTTGARSAATGRVKKLFKTRAEVLTRFNQLRADRSRRRALVKAALPRAMPVAPTSEYLTNMHTTTNSLIHSLYAEADLAMQEMTTIVDHVLWKERRVDDAILLVANASMADSSQLWTQLLKTQHLVRRLLADLYTADSKRETEICELQLALHSMGRLFLSEEQRSAKEDRVNASLMPNWEHSPQTSYTLSMIPEPTLTFSDTTKLELRKKLLSTSTQLTLGLLENSATSHPPGTLWLSNPLKDSSSLHQGSSS